MKIIRFSTDGLVIRENNIGDNDRLVTILTREYGVIKAFVVGAKSIKSKRSPATSLLSYSNFNIDKKGDTYKIVEATVNKVFFAASSDILVLSIAQYFCELCYHLGPEDNDCEEFLRLVLNSLYFLTEGKRSPELIKAITELRIACISGYTPNLIACNNCGEFEQDIMYFRLEDGTVYCDKCRKDGCIEVPLTIIKAMRHIVYSKLESLYSFDISEENAHLLSSITERYIVYQSERNYQTLDFVRGFL